MLNHREPEEIAKYFQEHKHELPRSHELCVNRFQDNEARLREFDAKYGDLVHMIQSLGQKHQSMLPDKGDNPEHSTQESKSNQNIEQWTDNVSLSHTKKQEDGEDENTDSFERVSHFDRPLKEIRVGESPSKPWGESVPVKYLDEAEAAPKGPAKNETCPFNASKLNVLPLKTTQSQPAQDEQNAGRAEFSDQQAEQPPPSPYSPPDPPPKKP